MTLGNGNDGSTASATRRGGRRLVRRGAATLLLAMVAAGGTVAATAGPAAASWYGASVGSWATGGVNVRDCYHPTVHLPPSTACTYVTTLPVNTGVHIVCQRTGQVVSGDGVWDYIAFNGGEGLVADAYMNTGYSSWIPGVDICS